MAGLPRRASAADCSNSPLPIISSRRPWEGSSPARGSQRGLGWVALRSRYDDGGLSGGTLDRPALRRLLSDIEGGRVDRLTRSLMDFARIIETFDARDVCFVSVTQQFNTANSMGRLTLNVLLSFAQFEREVTAERIRDKIAASKKKGVWMGGCRPSVMTMSTRSSSSTPTRR